jgi:2-polyprenyl-3-methyl-5-hydroxy-6-metoxy-1,4-benzoquinol methylase
MSETQMTSLQRSFWNRWNADNREQDIQEVSARQAEIIIGWLERLRRTDLAILEAGCGSGWLCPRLARFGPVTGTDLSDEVLDRARRRWPEVRFLSGDFMDLDLAAEAYDVVVTLEVLSHVADQKAFVNKMARHLRPGGLLMMATQNRPVLEKFNRIPPPEPGQLRRWVDKDELRRLLEPGFEIIELFSVTPQANRGLMRLVNSNRLNRPLRAVFGNRVERFKEAMGLGWTLMALARKRSR